MQRRQFLLGAVAGLAVPGLMPSLARAADVAGPVRIVVGFAPGGGTDVLARVIGQKLGDDVEHQRAGGEQTRRHRGHCRRICGETAT